MKDANEILVQPNDLEKAVVAIKATHFSKMLFYDYVVRDQIKKDMKNIPIRKT